jgi:hypothetical protein
LTKVDSKRFQPLDHSGCRLRDLHGMVAAVSNGAVDCAPNCFSDGTSGAGIVSRF